MCFTALRTFDTKNLENNNGGFKPYDPIVIGMPGQTTTMSTGAVNRRKVNTVYDTVVKFLGKCIVFFNENSYHKHDSRCLCHKRHRYCIGCTADSAVVGLDSAVFIFMMITEKDTGLKNVT